MNQSLLRELACPGNEYRGKPFWAWNGRLDPEELRRQVRVMHRMGLGGFFMHSRVGLGTAYLSEEWFDCIGACIDEAEKLGMEAWLYDEDRWPSGPAGGLVTKNPRYRARALALHQFDSPRGVKWDADTLAVYTATVNGTSASDVKRVPKGKRPKLAPGESVLVFRVQTAPCHSWYNGYTYLDTLSREAVKEFVRVTHEAYRKRFGEHFGKVIPGVFTDEPNHSGIFHNTQFSSAGISTPWTGKLPQTFKKRYGYSIVSHLPELFFNVDGQGITPARHNYHDCVTALFVDAFGRQIGQWCERNNMIHTGHVLYEDRLSYQTAYVGSAMRFYEYMQAPGIDILGEWGREIDTAKQVSSAARQFGQKWRLSETYGCTGWDFPLAGHKAVGDWQAAMGINLRCQHLSLYTMEGEAKRDYPASILHQSPWWEVYGKVEDYFARIHAAMTKGQEVRDLLVIHPIESMWVLSKIGWTEDPVVDSYDRMHVDLRSTLLAANIDFDFGDEDILARYGRCAKRDGEPGLVVGKARYKAVVVPPLLTMRRTTLNLLKRFHAAGGTVVFAGKPAGHLDASPSDEVANFARRCAKAPPKGARLAAAVDPTCRRVSIADAAGKEIAETLYLLREDKDTYYLFVCNMGHDCLKTTWEGIPTRKRTAVFPKVHICGLDGAKGRPIELDLDTGQTSAAQARRRGSGWEILTSLPALGSRLFIVPKTRQATPPARARKLKNLKTRKLDPRAWDIALSEANCLALDWPRYKVGSRPWRKANDVLRVDRAVRDVMGLPYRAADMVQPWAQVKSARPKRSALKLSYTFQVKATPAGDLALGIERPELYGITLNGCPVSTAAECGWWTDVSMRKIPIDSSLLRIGTNEITLECDYDENHPGLEIIYLLGAFGTRVRDRQMVMTETPRRLTLGSWVNQGLAFYGASVGYRTTISTAKLGRRRLVVQVPTYCGAAVRVLVDGKEAGVIAWEPNEVDITDCVTGEKTQLTVEVIGHRRNSHGPLHQGLKDPTSIGPWSFLPHPMLKGSWAPDYALVPCGLMKPPRLVWRG